MSVDLLFSVVVPTCHRDELLVQCLDRLAPGTQTLSPERYEVIVSDDGSVSTAEQLIKTTYPWAQWIKGPRRGIGANRNNGASQAKAPWIVFIDSDTLPDPDCLSAYAKAVTIHPEAIAFEGAIHPLGDLDGEWCLCPVNTTGGYFWTANVAVKREVFESIGGFDENCRAYHEDQDIYLRLLKIRSIDFLPDSIVVHPVRKVSFTPQLQTTVRRLKDWAYYVKKHGRELQQQNLPAVVWALLDIHFRTMVRYALRFHFESALLSLIWMGTSISLFPFFYVRQPTPARGTPAAGSISSTSSLT